jgi:uncharacterized membrane protein
MSSVIATDEAYRAHNRDRASILSGAAAGAGVGVTVGLLASSMPLAFAGLGAIAGALIGKLIGLHISADEWDPPLNQRPYVGGKSPDDDIASP